MGRRRAGPCPEHRAGRALLLTEAWQVCVCRVWGVTQGDGSAGPGCPWGRSPRPSLRSPLDRHPHAEASGDSSNAQSRWETKLRAAALTPTPHPGLARLLSPKGADPQGLAAGRTGWGRWPQATHMQGLCLLRAQPCPPAGRRLGGGKRQHGTAAHHLHGDKCLFLRRLLTVNNGSGSEPAGQRR